MSRLSQFSSEFKDLLQARKLNRIDRYQLENTIKSNTVSSHSHWVIIMSMIIYREVESYIKKTYKRSINYRALIEIATFHDLGECVTGDMDFVAKRAGVIDEKGEADFIMTRFHNSKVFGSYLESILIDHIGAHEWDKEKEIVKCADILEHLVYCYEEQELFGNPSMYEPLMKGVEVVHEGFRELYEESKFVAEVTNSCERVVKENPLA